jgi:hypothetical protein
MNFLSLLTVKKLALAAVFSTIALCAFVFIEVPAEAIESAGLKASLTSLSSQNFPNLFINARISLDGSPLNNLTAENFQCFENGINQTDAFNVTPPEVGGGVRLADVVFLIDASGSMGAAISGVKNNVIQFANSLANSDIDFRLGLVQFGQWENSGNPILLNNGNLTDDPLLFKDLVGTLSATGSYEPGFLALRMAAQNFNFRPGSQKIFILISDEDSDDRDKAGTIYLMQSGGITVHTAVNCSFVYSSGDYCDETSVRGMTGGLLFNVAGPYNGILESIAAQSASTYIIRYRSSQPSFDGVERLVECSINYDINEASFSGSYIPGSAPKIALSSETKKLIKTSFPENSSDVIIKAEVIDEVAPFIDANGVKLYYRTTGADGGYNFVVMNHNGQYYEAAIPVVKKPGIDFFIKASDSQQTSSLPSTDPDIAPFNIAVLPNDLPQILHSPVTASTFSQEIKISAVITDLTNMVAGAWLSYRHAGELIYNQIEMQRMSGFVYQAVIPSDYAAGNIEYYIEAKDDYNVSAFEGTKDEPFVVNVDLNSIVQPPFYVKVKKNIGASNFAISSKDEDLELMEAAFKANSGDEEGIKDFQCLRKVNGITCINCNECTEEEKDKNEKKYWGTFGSVTTGALQKYFNEISINEFFANNHILRVVEDNGEWQKNAGTDKEHWFVEDPSATSSRGWILKSYLEYDLGQQDYWSKKYLTLISPIINTTHNLAKVSSIFDHSGDFLCGFGFNSFNCDSMIISFLEGEVGEKKFGSDSSKGAPAYAKKTGIFFEESKYINYVGVSVKNCFDGYGDIVECQSNKSYLNYDGHPGVDYSYEHGTEIVAPADGILCLAIENTDKKKGLWIDSKKCIYGDDAVNTGDGSNGYEKHKTFYIIHGDSGFTTWYLHSSEIINSDLAFGTSGKGYRAVKRGQVIAKVGNTCSGCIVPYHLHFDVRDNNGSGYENLVDPYGKFFGNDGGQYESIWKKIPFDTITGIKLGSPGELRVYDGMGNVTGLVNGEIKEEIPFSSYVNESVLIYNTPIARIEIFGTGKDIYQLELTHINGQKRVNFSAIDVMTSPGENHIFTPNLDGMLEGEENGIVKIEIDKDGDGIVDKTFEAGNQFSDVLSPSTDITVIGDNIADGLYLGKVDFALEAIDNLGGIGVQKTEYSFDNGITWHEYTEPVTISEYGQYTMLYRSIDWFGNQEEDKSVSFRVVTARELAADARARLGEAQEDNAVKQAIKQIDLALDKGFWEDDNTLTKKGGQSVVAHLENAVRQIKDRNDLVDIKDDLELAVEILSGKKKKPVETVGGGGGLIVPSSVISESVRVSEVGRDKAVITWFTPQFSVGKIVFSGEYESRNYDDKKLPDYGYARAVEEKMGGAGNHRAVLTGLKPGTTYYFRCVSPRYPELSGREYSFTTAGKKQEVKVLGVEYADFSGIDSLYGLDKDLTEAVSLAEAEMVFGAEEIELTGENKKIYEKLINGRSLGLQMKNSMAYFIQTGTPTARRLGAGERAGTVNSYLSAFKDFPEAVSDWQDVIKIANGRWPGRESMDAKTAAEKRFGKVYKRNMKQGHQNDDSAISIISYGLRPANRNMESEKAAIKTFRQVFKRAPEGAGDWDIVRAVAYSGARR